MLAFAGLRGHSHEQLAEFAECMTDVHKAFSATDIHLDAFVGLGIGCGTITHHHADKKVAVEGRTNEAFDPDGCAASRQHPTKRQPRVRRRAMRRMDHFKC